ncbi:dimethylamine monooxygenase subunit DmmA family protein [Hyphomicrobium sp.]|uniref:dimethylamine monooxygenase subunit DmmA family protein n=1 Tax=Hyphomicrobium sp. TaxID=82 RepID=UPI002E346A87|nr:dimethylamine monooxygenase subunit DmmA family protein [Hyphomicrobium sp.]HEX2840494.1 dimethylamine monooxygenase subunit DmmA family protein [Hyphomicrobium sp.]
MLVSDIKSRPIYPGLEPDLYALSNLIVCDRAGAEAVSDMMRRADARFAERSAILICAEDFDQWKAIDEAIQGFKPAVATTFPSLNDTILELDALLGGAKMGVCVYAAGSEPLIGSVVQTAMRHHIDHRSVRTEHRGSLKRRVQCVHCKALTENVTTNPVKCSGCGLMLLVRDHYSRRFAAFQGVCIDAEVPGEIPEQKAEFL